MAIRLSLPAESTFSRLSRQLTLSRQRTRAAIARRRSDLAQATLVVARVESPATDLTNRELSPRDASGFLVDAMTPLCELICDAANIGIEPWMQPKYEARRAHLQAHWPLWRAALRPYLPRNADGVFDDPFAPLFTPPTLAQLLETDNGDLIARLYRASDILEIVGKR